jgi:Mg2+/Co2+ transporter CorB
MSCPFLTEANVENLSLLIALLVVLVLASAFFSASETGMMAINRYRLRHLARGHHKAAKLTQRLLERTDRLLGVILAGNTLANMLASSIATVIAIELYGNVNIAPLAGIIIAVFILIFSEVIPKTLAALYPERAAFSAAAF